MKWLAIVFVFTLAFASTVVESDLGYVDVEGVIAGDGYFTLNGSTLKLTAVSSKEFLAINYSVDVIPKNLGRIATDMGLPLSGPLNYLVPMGQVHTHTLKLPDIVCGTYKISGDMYYVFENITQVYTDNLKLSIPCKDFKSRIVSGLVAKLPYPVLKFFAGFLGIKFG